METVNMEISRSELVRIVGGESDAAPGPNTSLVEDISFVLGAVLKGIVHFSRSAAQYQTSLPAHLKK